MSLTSQSGSFLALTLSIGLDSSLDVCGPAAAGLEAPELPALELVRLRAAGAQHRALLSVPHDQRGGANDVARADRHPVAEGRVDAHEAVVADAAVTRHDNVGGDEAVVLDRRVVTDVIAAPQHAVVADLHT